MSQDPGHAATAAAAAAAAPASTQSAVSMSQLRAVASGADQVTPQQHKDDDVHHQQHAPIVDNKNSRLTHLKKGSAISREDVIHFVHRLGIFAAALFYVVSCLQVVPDIVKLLRGTDNPVIETPTDDSAVMRYFIGSTTMRESPLVVAGLGDSTNPVPSTLYLTNTSYSSLSPCDPVLQNPSIQILYGNEYQRQLYDSIVYGAAYNLTFLDPIETELIAPVIDCTIGGIAKGETTYVQSFYLVRKVKDPEDVYLISLVMANMEYTLPDQAEGGPAAVATLEFTNDLQISKTEHHLLVSIGFPFEKLDFRVYEYYGLTNTGTWSLRTIPKDPDRELSKRLFASSRTGCYVKTEFEQSNINSEVWILDDKPADVIAQMHFSSVALLRDSWAWVHLIELWFGLDVLLNLIILLVVSCHNLMNGTLWMGDSFVAVSSTLIFRGGIVILSWYVDKFWSLIEFCTRDASAVANTETMAVYESITHADLLSLFLSLSGVLGMLFRERVDPLFAVICFEIGYGYRREILKGFPDLLKIVSDYAHTIYTSSTQAAAAGQSEITPMQFRSTFATTTSVRVNFSVLIAFAWCFFAVVLFILANKFFFHFHPEKLLILRSKNTSSSQAAHKSENEEALLALKRQYTLFEVATGAQLENRFGLMSHYITCVFVKGTKFASADGIYSNGFVIANNKFLVQARDLLWIVLMKMAQTRFMNVYVYELKGNSVQQKARLVYPETLTWKDLLLINITILS